MSDAVQGVLKQHRFESAAADLNPEAPLRVPQPVLDGSKSPKGILDEEVLEEPGTGQLDGSKSPEGIPGEVLEEPKGSKSPEGIPREVLEEPSPGLVQVDESKSPEGIPREVLEEPLEDTGRQSGDGFITPQDRVRRHSSEDESDTEPDDDDDAHPNDPRMTQRYSVRSESLSDHAVADGEAEIEAGPGQGNLRPSRPELLDRLAAISPDEQASLARAAKAGDEEGEDDGEGHSPPAAGGSRGRGKGRGRARGRGKGKGKGGKASKRGADEHGEDPPSKKVKTKKDETSDDLPKKGSEIRPAKKARALKPKPAEDEDSANIEDEGTANIEDEGTANIEDEGTAKIEKSGRGKPKASAKESARPKSKAKASPKLKGKARAKAKGKAKAKAKGKAKAKAKGKAKARVARIRMADLESSSSEDGFVPKTEEERVAYQKAVKSRKSTAYHRAQKDAKARGLDTPEAKEHAKEDWGGNIASLFYYL